MDAFASSLLTRSVINVPPMGPGLEWCAQVPANEAWLIKAITATCTYTTGGVAGPIPVLILDDSQNIFAEAIGAATAPGTNTTVTYTWAPNMVVSTLQGAGADVHAQAPLPGGPSLVLSPGWRARSHTINLSASIAWTSVKLYVVKNSIGQDFSMGLGAIESPHVADTVALART